MNQQIVSNRKSISRKSTNPQSWNLQATLRVKCWRTKARSEKARRLRV